MKIRKIKPSVGILGKILNIFSNSNKDSYSCKYINDTYGGGIKNYSTNEVKLNEKWIDGKPIYRKVVEHIIGQSWKDVEGISNIEHCFGVTGYFELNQDEEFIIPFTAAGGSNTIGLWFSVSKITHKLRQATNNQGYYNKKIILIVEYTKTTD